MKNSHKEKNDLQDNREFGVRRASSNLEKALDEKLNLQIISIRLQKDLINELKILSTEDGLGYQPYIRQLLTSHVRNQKRKRNKQSHAGKQ